METYVLGSAVTIVAILEEDLGSGGTATISIYDSDDSLRVTAATMTEDQERVFSYIYQSTDDNIGGAFKAVIKITYGGYTSIDYKFFELVDVQP